LKKGIRFQKSIDVLKKKRKVSEARTKKTKRAGGGRTGKIRNSIKKNKNGRQTRTKLGLWLRGEIKFR